jgi:hypothetical protein
MSTTTKVSFESEFQTQFSLSPLQAIAEFRTEVNPYQTFDEYQNEFVIPSDVPTDKQDEISTAFADWILDAQDALDSYQMTLMEKHAARDIWEELDLTPDTRKDKLSNYKTKTVVSFDTVFKDGAITSRDVWDRTTGVEHDTIVLTEYGIFNPMSTSRAHAAWMRVRRVKRHGVEWLTIGSIQINMSNGEFYCGVSRCEFAHRLTDQCSREHMEYQVMLLLQHLGTHAPKGDRAYPYVPILDVEPTHTSDSRKIETHIYWCTNDKCNHTNLT